MTAHRPERGSDVEAWIKAQRDGWTYGHEAWFALDMLLDDYRLHADTGTSLGKHACSPACIPGVTCEGDKS